MDITVKEECVVKRTSHGDVKPQERDNNPTFCCYPFVAIKEALKIGWAKDECDSEKQMPSGNDSKKEKPLETNLQPRYTSYPTKSQQENTSSIYTQAKTTHDDGSSHCYYCGRRFSRKGNLPRHLLIHTGEKPFQCVDCGKSFRQKAQLKNHMISHTGERAFHCKECGKNFSRKAALTAHMLTHTGDEPFSCTECGRRFTVKRNFNDHVRTHSGEKPFPCINCGKCFTQTSSLNRHKKTCHIPEKSPY